MADFHAQKFSEQPDTAWPRLGAERALAGQLRCAREAAGLPGPVCDSAPLQHVLEVHPLFTCDTDSGPVVLGKGRGPQRRWGMARLGDR